MYLNNKGLAGEGFDTSTFFNEIIDFFESKTQKLRDELNDANTLATISDSGDAKLAAIMKPAQARFDEKFKSGEWRTENKKPDKK